MIATFSLSEPRANKLQTLSGILNVSIPWLLTGEGVGVDIDPAEGPGPDAAALLAEIRVLRTEMLRTAERMGVIEKRLKGILTHSMEPAE